MKPWYQDWFWEMAFGTLASIVGAVSGWHAKRYRDRKNGSGE